MRLTTRASVSERSSAQPTVNGFSLPPSPPSPSASSSSSEFEFAVSLSLTSKKPSSHLCPADELFYKGQLLPLQLSPRLNMVRTLLASSSSSSCSDTTTSGSRDSSGSSNDSSSLSGDFFHLNDCDSSRPSSATEDDEFKKAASHHQPIKKSKYFSLSLFASVFHRKEKTSPNPTAKKIGASAKEVIKKYVKKVKKPLYDKLAQKNQTQGVPSTAKPKGTTTLKQKSDGGGDPGRERLFHHLSFSGNLSQRYPARQTRSCVMSCPSSMRSSPSRGGPARGSGYFPDLHCSSSSSSSMEDLQSAIQGAIAHCKNSMAQTNHK